MKGAVEHKVLPEISMAAWSAAACLLVATTAHHPVPPPLQSGQPVCDLPDRVGSQRLQGGTIIQRVNRWVRSLHPTIRIAYNNWDAHQLVNCALLALDTSLPDPHTRDRSR